MAFKGITAFILNNGEGGGGGEPTGNYNDLTNHPQINGNELIGNKTADQLGLLPADTDIPTKLSDLDEDTTHRTVTDSEKQSWNNKVDSVAGKGLSTNDYTDDDQEDVAKVDGLVSSVGSLTSRVGIAEGKVRTLEGEMLSVQNALDTKVDKVTGKDLSTNDYSNEDKAIVDGVTTALAGKVDTSSVGTANGVAGLDNTGRVPSSQLPSYVDDVLEYASLSAFPVTGEGGKIYVALDTNKIYRWSGSVYVEISESLALGETQGTAYEGNKGKANADAIAAIQETIGGLGTASTKNSTSVVTESSDLVESGAVFDALGWGNKNLANLPDKTVGTGLFIDDTPVDLPIGTYTVSFTVSGTIGTDHAYQVIDNSTSPQKILETADLIEGRNSITFTTDAPITKLKGYTNSSNTLNYSNFQLEKGSTATAYEPYHASVEEYCASKELLEDTVGWTGKNRLSLANLGYNTPSNLSYNVSGGIVYVTKSATSGNVSIGIFNQANIDDVALSLKGKTITITGGKSDNKYIQWWDDVNGVRQDKGTGITFEFPATASSFNLQLIFTANATASNEPFYLQVEIGSQASAFEPYHPTVDETKCDNSVIAPVENGTTASQAYAVGEHFIRNGAFCTVTQAISSGGTLTKGTNYTSGDVASEFGLYIPITNNAGFHNSIFRGKNLGSSVTTAQKTAIANGTFEDMYIGDYWEINSIKWRIAHFDYWLNCGDTQCTTHHVVVVPDSALVNKRMNAKVDNVDTTAGAYVNSEMRTTNLADAKTIVNAAFGADNILGHREYMQNAVTDGYESAGTWVNADIELMSEIMVYGSNIFHNVKCGTALPSLYTVNKTQLALFRLDPSYIICKNVAQTDLSAWWLRDVISATDFALIHPYGGANYYGASNSNGVRPAFGIK